jgi:maltose-binding protein MalE
MQANADLSLQNKSFVRLTGTPGITALNLYTSVKAPAVETYTGFAGESLGMIIDYQSAEETLAIGNPFLNFGVAPLPQLNKNAAVVPARYYGFAVSSKSPYQALAWEYVSYATTNVGAAEDYLTASGRPPALRSLIQAYLNSPTQGVFASQALIARSWNMPASEGVFAALNTMIRSALSGTNTQNVLQEAENAINNLVR